MLLMLVHVSDCMQGGFGKVYQALHKESGDVLAVKSMRKDTTLQCVACARVIVSAMSFLMKKVFRYNVAGTRTERSVMEQLNGHPFICSLQYAFQTEGRLYLCMDYASGGQLLQHIDARSPMDEKDVKVAPVQLTAA
jgi:serine/threonine protein kinase